MGVVLFEGSLALCKYSLALVQLLEPELMACDTNEEAERVLYRCSSDPCLSISDLTMTALNMKTALWRLVGEGVTGLQSPYLMSTKIHEFLNIRPDESSNIMTMDLVAIYLDHDLDRGRSRASASFDSRPLAGDEEGDLRVVDVEVTRPKVCLCGSLGLLWLMAAASSTAAGIRQQHQQPLLQQKGGANLHACQGACMPPETGGDEDALRVVVRFERCGVCLCVAAIESKHSSLVDA
ncbi:hypothetical protein ACSSS7_000270 [Eimeria intestinalis]